jgi:hypothetical protein
MRNLDCTVLDLPSPAVIAHRALNTALRAYAGLSRRKRTRRAWVYVENALWNARQDAVAAGVLARGSQSWEFVTGRLHDANAKVERARLAESMGHADFRI